MGTGLDVVIDGPTLVLRGAFDVRSTMEVRTAVYDLLRTHHRDIVVDLRQVDSVDVTALKVLAVATREASRTGHRLLLRGCGPAVRRLLHLSRLRRAVQVERTIISA